MGEKAFASLSSGLLARKGQARPAMRPQGFAIGLGHPEDLGWNDMGYNDTDEVSHRRPGPRLPASLSGAHASLPVGVAANADVPAVVHQQEEIAREFAAAVEPEPVAVQEPVTAAASISASAPALRRPAKLLIRRPRRPSAASLLPTPPREESRKSAFTLRLNAERHLHLRLACAVTNRSAQQIVTEALDRLLESLPEVGKLAASLPDPDASRNGKH